MLTTTTTTALQEESPVGTDAFKSVGGKNDCEVNNGRIDAKSYGERSVAACAGYCSGKTNYFSTDDAGVCHCCTRPTSNSGDSGRKMYKTLTKKEMLQEKYSVDCNKRNYVDSQKFCRDHGGAIATFHDSDEAQAARPKIRCTAYIGAESDGQGNWQWTDNSEWWLYGNNDGMKGTGEIRAAWHTDGEWHDWLRGQAKLGVVCMSTLTPGDSGSPCSVWTSRTACTVEKDEKGEQCEWSDDDRCK